MDTHQDPHLRRIPDQCPCPHYLNPPGQEPSGEAEKGGDCWEGAGCWEGWDCRRGAGRGGDVPPALRPARQKSFGMLHMESMLSKSTSGFVPYLSNVWGFLVSLVFGRSSLLCGRILSHWQNFNFILCCHGGRHPPGRSSPHSLCAQYRSHLLCHFHYHCRAGLSKGATAVGPVPKDGLFF
ncbi:hypothetical protein ElyMa_003921800 [Elysia marginata]|uniref:Uncharacterized protein n=1 Tax=Elysia marginata TaxID=1093978 RepID=A0AAV4FS03_9GAST|nr:hypothetical protein ElyMa_003921800 [Elysia marginata]